MVIKGIFFSLSPTLDPDLRTLQINTAECPDTQLLMAIIFTRYVPSLLTFPFQGKRSIAPETIEYAKKINERFPICHKKVDNLNGGGQAFNLQPRDLNAEKFLALGLNNPSITTGLVATCLKAMFDSSRTYGLFTAYFDAELYHYAAHFYNNKVFNRYNYINAVVGIERVLEDVEISRRNRPLYQDMQRLLIEDFAYIHDDAQIVRRFKNFFTARVDIQLNLNKTPDKEDLKILSYSDERASIEQAYWLPANNVGYAIHSHVGKLEFVAKVAVDGRISLALKGLDVHDSKDYSKRIPYWIDYTKLTVNGKVIFDKIKSAWHNKPYIYSMNLKAGEEFKVKVEWLPHKSDT